LKRKGYRQPLIQEVIKLSSMMALLGGYDGRFERAAAPSDLPESGSPFLFGNALNYLDPARPGKIEVWAEENKRWTL
jgi:hypothetical protein